MGVIDNIGQKLRSTFAKDKDKKAIELAKGATINVGGAGDQFNLLQTYGMNALSEYLQLDHDMMTRFVDYEEMDDYPEIAAALDIFADDSTQTDTQTNRAIWVESQDRTLQQNLDDLIHRTLRMDEDIWEIGRTVAKYGNDYEELLVTGDGVVGFNFLPPPTVRRIEGARGELHGFIQDFQGKLGFTPDDLKQLLHARANAKPTKERPQNVGLEDWEVVHFRLRGKFRRSVYGHSVLEPARWIYKRLLLLEDAALIYRLQRAPERFAFYIDVGDMPPAEALAYVNRVRQQMKKQKFFNPSTGKLDMRMNPMAQDEDFFIPSRKGTDGTRVETVGAPSWQSMEDIEYFQDKLFAAIKIPKAYLGKEDGTVRAVLSQEDVRFARTVLRLQREIRNGLWKTTRVHLAAQGLDPYKARYDIKMTVPSSIFELAQLEVRNARADLATRMKEFVSLHWILRRVFGISDDEIETLMKEREEDAVREQLNQAKGQSAAEMLMQQAQQAAGMGGGEAGSGAPQFDGGGGEDQEQQLQSKKASEKALLTDALRRRRNTWKGSRITERELFAGGNRESEKRAEDKLAALLKNDKQFAARLNEIGAMLHDVRDLTRTKRP